jgi:DNA invertase Pin-like site-specific DNA recombinase
LPSASLSPNAERGLSIKYKIACCFRYRDNGQNGVTLDRPELRNMLSDIQSGVIKTVIVRDRARLSRNYIQLDELVNLLTANDVLLISVADGGVINGAPDSLAEIGRLLRLFAGRHCYA